MRENTAMARRDSRRDSRRHTVAVLATDGTAPFELAVACEVFGIDRSELGVPWYRFMVVAGDEPPIRTKAGFSIDTPYRLADLRCADTVVVPMWQPALAPRPELLDALRAAHAQGARMLSLCTGAFLLAAAGLLDGRRATTHWMYAGELARCYREVDVDPNVLFVDAGNGIFTSAGTAAGIDLCLHIVRLDHGAEVANKVARRMVVPPQRDGGQAQFVDAPVPATPDDDVIGRILEWAVGHLHEPLTVDDLARRALLSSRTFARRFRAVTGTTPMQWLLRQRVLHAQRLLEATDLPIELVAQQCGFGTATSFRTHFRRLAGTSPAAYRRTFRLDVVAS